MSGALIRNTTTLNNQTFQDELKGNAGLDDLRPLVEYLNHLQADMAQSRTWIECIFEWLSHIFPWIPRVPSKISPDIPETNLKPASGKNSINPSVISKKIEQYLAYCERRNNYSELKMNLMAIKLINDHSIIFREDKTDGTVIIRENSAKLKGLKFSSLQSLINYVQKNPSITGTNIAKSDNKVIIHEEGTVSIEEELTERQDSKPHTKFQDLNSYNTFMHYVQTHKPNLDLKIALDTRESLIGTLEALETNDNKQSPSDIPEKNKSELINSFPYRFPQINLLVHHCALIGQCPGNKQQHNEIKQMDIVSLGSTKVYSKDYTIRQNDNFGAAQPLYLPDPGQGGVKWDTRYTLENEDGSLAQKAFEELSPEAQGVFHDLRGLLWTDLYYLQSLSLNMTASYMMQSPANSLVNGLRDERRYKQALIDCAIKKKVIMNQHPAAMELFLKPYSW